MRPSPLIAWLVTGAVLFNGTDSARAQIIGKGPPPLQSATTITTPRSGPVTSVVPGSAVPPVGTRSAVGQEFPLTTVPRTGTLASVLANYALDVYAPDSIYANQPGLAIMDSAPNSVGFKARAYYDTASGIAVVSYRGTDKGGSDYERNKATDIAFARGQKDALDPLIAKADDFMKSVKTTFPDAKIDLTGHSLGGMIAQIEGVKTGYKTMTFNAPGVENATAFDNDRIRIAADQVDVTNYVTSDDRIGEFGAHIGPVVQLPANTQVPEAQTDQSMVGRILLPPHSMDNMSAQNFSNAAQDAARNRDWQETVRILTESAGPIQAPQNSSPGANPVAGAAPPVNQRSTGNHVPQQSPAAIFQPATRPVPVVRQAPPPSAPRDAPSTFISQRSGGQASPVATQSSSIAQPTSNSGTVYYPGNAPAGNNSSLPSYSNAATAYNPGNAPVAGNSLIPPYSSAGTIYSSPTTSGSNNNLQTFPPVSSPYAAPQTVSHDSDDPDKGPADFEAWAKAESDKEYGPALAEFRRQEAEDKEDAAADQRQQQMSAEFDSQEAADKDYQAAVLRMQDASSMTPADGSSGWSGLGTLLGGLSDVLNAATSAVQSQQNASGRAPPITQPVAAPRPSPPTRVALPPPTQADHRCDAVWAAGLTCGVP
jgi:hypothetical protein